MPIKFNPTYSITSKVVADLMRTEEAKQKILHLSLTPTILAHLGKLPGSIPPLAN